MGESDAVITSIADYLNDQVAAITPHGHRWHNETIRDILNRSSQEAVA